MREKVSVSAHVIIVAGGRGCRAGGGLPKQFVSLGGVPVLMHTLAVFARALPGVSCVVVLPEDYVAHWQQLCQTHDFQQAHRIVVGGATRFQSVRAGLDVIGDTGYVSIHDGVRPLLRPALVLHTFAAAQRHHVAVAAIGVADSIREEVTTGTTLQRDRRKYFLVQTPQTFRVDLLKEAYRVEEGAGLFTDDASVWEHAGHQVHLITGARDNIKLTYAEDFIWAAQRVGQCGVQYSSSLKKKSSLEG